MHELRKYTNDIGKKNLTVLFLIKCLYYLEYNSQNYTFLLNILYFKRSCKIVNLHNFIYFFAIILAKVLDKIDSIWYNMDE